MNKQVAGSVWIYSLSPSLFRPPVKLIKSYLVCIIPHSALILCLYTRNPVCNVSTVYHAGHCLYTGTSQYHAFRQVSFKLILHPRPGDYRIDWFRSNLFLYVSKLEWPDIYFASYKQRALEFLCACVNIEGVHILMQLCKTWVLCLFRAGLLKHYSRVVSYLP